MPHLEHQLFPEEYFTGADISLYFGDTWIDEVLQINVTVQEQLRPVYGFQSFVPNSFMRGARQVMGSFAIPFRETHWLQRILEAERKRRGQRSRLPQHPDERRTTQDRLAESFPVQRSLISEDVETVKEHALKAGLAELRRLSRHYQEAMWDQATQPASPAQSPLFQAGDHDGFTIVIVAGVPMQGPKGEPITPHATSIIKGVQIMNKTLVIESNDNIVLEAYHFMAKDLDGPLFASARQP